jgi:tetratricopeptide (TPR) repeat protein
MRKFIGSITCMLFLFLTFPGVSQKMTWTTKSTAAKELVSNGADHFMNAEFAQAYNDFTAAVKLDPDFTVALAFLTNLTRGETQKMYAKRTLESAGNKTDGEKLFASLTDEKNKRAERADIVAKLHTMFPDGKVLASLYIQTRVNPDEGWAAAQDYLKKFPDDPSIYNTMGYYNLQVKKDTAAAKQYFEKYITMYPDGCNPYDSMGEFYLDTGDTANAEKYYKMALEKYPFNISSVEALEKIEAGKKK